MRSTGKRFEGSAARMIRGAPYRHGIRSVARRGACTGQFDSIPGAPPAPSSAVERGGHDQRPPAATFCGASARTEVRCDMREPILAWYQYPFPAGTVYFARHLQDADTVVQVFGHACAGAARITPEGWRFLWAFFGLEGLTRIARVGDCFEGSSDEQ